MRRISREPAAMLEHISKLLGLPTRLHKELKSHIYDAYNDKNLEKEETEIEDLVHKFG